MPYAAPRRCTGCGQLVHGNCPTCGKPWAQRPTSWPGAANDPRWRAVRKLRLQVEPWCRECGVQATTADHLDGTDYRDDSGAGSSWLNIDMTRSLCKGCHASRTGKQGAAARRGR